MKILRFLLASAILCLFVACSGDKTGTESTPPDSTKTQSAAEPAAPTETNVGFVTQVIRDVEDISPLTAVSIRVGGDEYPVDSVSVAEDIEPAAWPNYMIPADAKQAVGGWWAGAGDYFYFKVVGTDAVVYYGWADETAPENEMYQYKEVKRVPLVRQPF